MAAAQPSDVLPFPKSGPRPPSVRQQVEALNRRGLYICTTADGDVLLLRKERDEVRLGGACNETVHESASALYGMERDRDYARACHVGGAVDAVLERARRQLEETQAVLQGLVERGLRLRVEDGTLWVKGPAGWADDAELAETVRANKERLMTYLGNNA